MSPDEIQQIFFVECDESLVAAEDGLAACKAGTQEDDTVNAVFRAVHSIKGGAGAFGYDALQAYTHTFETLLSDVRDETIELTGELVDLLLIALDTLSDHVRSAREGGDAPDDAELLKKMEAARAGGGDAADEPAAAATEEEPAEDSAPADDEDEMGLDLDSMLADLAGPSEPAEAEAPKEEKRWKVHVRPHGASMANGSEPLLMLRELAELGGTCARCDTAQMPTLDSFELKTGYLGWTFTMPESTSEESVRDIFDFVGDDCGLAIGEDEGIPEVRHAEAAVAKPEAPAKAGKAEAAAPETPSKDQPAPVVAAVPDDDAKSKSPPPTKAPAAGQSIRIDLAKLDRLIDSVGELVIAQAMLAQRLSDDGSAASEEMSMLEVLTRDIQESAMSIRAQPIGSVFSRVPRILRELASSTGKHVKLEVSGEQTELDKTVIERLGEPLTHLIRNAVDHGIEDAAERLAAGKDAEGVLTLSAEHRSGRIHICIADDGKGINREKVLEKAIEKGLVAPDAQLSGEEIDNLIFAPGFSTAQTVTNVSGRGVGMDVVRQNVKDLGGRITIHSEVGKGTTFTLTLPLTLAISDGMIVRVGDDTLVVPLAHVVESLKIEPGQIRGMGTKQKMLKNREDYIPVLPISNVLGSSSNNKKDDGEGVVIVVDTEAFGQAALLVDDICDQRQFVIKSLDTHFHAVEGISGATILGDGKVALILDVDGLFACSIGKTERLAA